MPLFEKTICVPGSKSITQRALVTAALGQGTSTLVGPLRSEDPLLLKDALVALGCNIEEKGDDWVINGTGGIFAPAQESCSIFMGNNGTGIRFLTAVVCLLKKGPEIELTCTERMEARPIEPLLQALRAMGANVKSKFNTGCPPVVIVPDNSFKGGDVTIDASKSSQYLSALLLIAPYTKVPTRISLVGSLASSPYLKITLSVMEAFGIKVEEEGGTFLVPQGRYRARDFQIEGDASSASYFFAGAAITGSSVTVENLPQYSVQGDARFVDLLEEMGCTVMRSEKGTTVVGPSVGGLKGIEVSMRDMPDMVPTLAAIAPFANGTTIIKDCPHLRIKETDRLAAMATELARLGADVEELDDGLIIRGGKSLRPSLIKTYDDHRIAMSFAVVGLKVKGLEIEDPSCVKKSFSGFWELWGKTFLEVLSFEF